MPELDGLRGVGILSVVLAHYTFFIVAYDVPFKPLKLILMFMPWRVWMDMFFILSGFLIGGVLLRSKQSPNYFSTFYITRFYRIFPVFYVWLCVFWMIVWLSPNILGLTGDIRRGLVITSCFLYFPNWIGPEIIKWSPLAVTWSLGVEEQFYAVAPWLVRYTTRRQLVFVLILLILAAPIFRVSLHMFFPANSPWYAYALTPCRLDEFAIGILLALTRESASWDQWMKSHIKQLYGVLTLLFFVNLIQLPWTSDFNSTEFAYVGQSTVAMFFGALILVLIYDSGGKLAAFFRLRVLAAMGTISYCTYLIHVPIDLAVHRIFRHSKPSISDWQGVGLTVVAFLISLIIASISWRYFERPLIERGHRLAKKIDLGAGHHKAQPSVA